MLTSLRYLRQNQVEFGGGCMIVAAGALRQSRRARKQAAIFPPTCEHVLTGFDKGECWEYQIHANSQQWLYESDATGMIYRSIREL